MPAASQTGSSAGSAGKPCKHCAAGIELRGSDHWIVKSIVPARIDIRKCTAPYYEYVRRTYDVNPGVGQRVQHTVTKKFGAVARENKSQSHYVMVKFDGQNFALPCHPTELNYSPIEDAALSKASS